MRAFVGIVTAIAFAAALLLVIDNRTPIGGTGKRGRDALISASEQLSHRPLHGRLSGGFPYRPAHATRRDSRSLPRTHPASKPLLNAVRMVNQELQTGRTVGSLHAAGLTHLLLGQSDAAIALFEEALLRDTRRADIRERIHRSGNAALLSDLAAAYGARGRIPADLPDRILAHEASERAWMCARTPEVAWNRALARENLGLTEDARAAWNDYLRLDPASQWAAEVRRFHAVSLSHPRAVRHVEPQLRQALVRGDAREVFRLVYAFPMESRIYAEDVAAGEWARAESHAERSSAFGKLRLLGEALASHRGDRLILDSAEAIQRATAGKLAALVRGHGAYAEGRQLATNRPTDAAARFEAATAELEAAGSPFAAVAIMRRSGCLFRVAAYDAARRQLDALPSRQQLGARGYFALDAQVEWSRGIIAMEQGQPEIALSAYHRALARFARLREFTNENNVRTLAAQAASYCGDDGEAWRLRLQALRVGGAPDADAANRHVILVEAGLTLMDGRFPHTARVVLDRAVAVARNSATQSHLCTALAWRALDRSGNGDWKGAELDFHDASLRCSNISDASVRARVFENLDVVAARLSGSSQRVAVQHLTKAIGFARKTGSHLRLASLYAQRARVHAEHSEVVAAQVDAQLASAQLDAQLSGPDGRRLRKPFVAAARDIIATRLAVDLMRDDAPGAIASADWVLRLASMVPWESVRMPAQGAFADIQKQLRPNAAIVIYVLDGDALYTIVVLSAKTHSRILRVGGRAIVADAADLAAAVYLRDPNNFDGAARRLYDALIAPLAEQLTGVTTLAVVSDEALRNIPFGALIDRSGRRLIERLTIVTAPTIQMLRDPRRRVNGNTRNGAVLIASGAKSIPNQREYLSYLKREQRAIARFYPDAIVADAFEPREFLRVVGETMVTHYTGHAVVNETSPTFSALFLTGARRPQPVYAHMIASTTFRSAPAVILAGCSTGRSTGGRKSMGSLTHAFLAGGASVVVGTLWDIEDSSATFLFSRIHASIAESESPAIAVRRAQLACLASSASEWRSPMFWGTVVVVGGDDVWNR